MILLTPGVKSKRMENCQKIGKSSETDFDIWPEGGMLEVPLSNIHWQNDYRYTLQNIYGTS